MKLSELERAREYEVRTWLAENLSLSPYQKELAEDIFRESEYYVYKEHQPVQTSLLWRLTIILYPVYIIAILLFLPLKWVFTGKWGLSRRYYDGFHSKWCKKLKI